MTKISCVVALVAGGCVIGDGEDVAVSDHVAELACNPLNCPGNSDLIGLLGPYELDRTGVQYSSRGFRIIGMSYLGQPATAFDVIGTTPQVKVGASVVSGASLVGLKLNLHHLPTNKVYQLEIQNYTSVSYYVPNGGWIWGYKIKYTEPSAGGGSVPMDLCPYAQHVDDGVDSSWAVISAGDRINPVTGAIIASDYGAYKGVGPWFNISCAGEATIKMLRARTGGAVNLNSPIEQRQATLNMFTAAYCGPNGKRYTKLGQQIDWADVSGPHSITSTSYEAVWRGSGALCLDTPRMPPTSPIACTLGPCAALIPDWKKYGWLLSGIP